MKTQIIQLEPHDDTISIKDKMDWSQTSRILLILPDQGKLLRNKFDLLVLGRYSTELGTQLALVTKDSEICYHANQLGIPVFANIKTAQRKPWRKPQLTVKKEDLLQSTASLHEADLHERPTTKKELIELPLWGKLVMFSIAVLSVLAIAFLLLPRAEIILPISDQPQELLLPVVADATIDEIFVSGVIPARKISETIKHRSEITASGTTQIPENFASGEVIFTNLTDLSLTIPENTYLSTVGDDPLFFQTRTALTLPDEYGAQEIVDIIAVQPGSAGNVAANQIMEITADFGADALVTNPEPTSGGTDLTIPSPTERDREQLLAQALAESKQKAVAVLVGNISPDNIIICNSPELENIEEQYYSPQINTPGDRLQIDLTAEFSCYYVQQLDLQLLTEEFLLGRYRGENIIPVIDSIEYTQVGIPEMDGQISTPWQLKVSWKEKLRIDEQEALQLVLGQKPEQAMLNLVDMYNLETSPEIILFPEWWFRMPVLPFRVDFR